MADGDARDGITRRDFLDGMAITAAGLAAAAAAPNLTGAEAAVKSGHDRWWPQPPKLPPGYYPPTGTGIKGQPDRVLDGIYRIDGWPNVRAAAEHSAKPGPGIRVPIRGGPRTTTAWSSARGRAGSRRRRLPRPLRPGQARAGARSAAGLRRAFAPQRVPCPERGRGGADLMILRNGGTVNLDSIGAWNQPAGSLLDIPGSYGQPALDMLAYCGVDPNNFPTASAPGIPATYGLRQMLLFPAADWGADTLAQNRVNATEPNTVAGWTAFVNRLPFSAPARRRSCASRPTRRRTGSRPSTAR